MADEGCVAWTEKSNQENTWTEKEICSAETGLTSNGMMSSEDYDGTGGKINIYLFGKMISAEDYDGTSGKVTVSLLGPRHSTESYDGNGKTVRIYRVG